MQCRLSAAVFDRPCGGLNYSTAYSAADLRTVFYATYIANKSGEPVPTAEVRETVGEYRDPSGRYGSSTFQTYYAVGALHYAGATPREPTRTVAWIREHRADDAGYRLSRGGREAPAPDLLATYTSVRTLHWLDTEPRNASALAAWLRDLESPNGGFHFSTARTTSPSLASIYYGTTVLDTLAADP